MSSPKFPTPTHLIIVCCHGIWLGKTPSEENWLIQDFQNGETPTFIEHIKIGLRLLVEDEPGKSALMFSGAPTRPETHISEAESYLSLAESQGFWGIIPSSTPQSSATRYSPLTPRSNYTPYLIAESRALDSFQNITLPMEAFSAIFGRPPKKVTVISHEFKRPRFTELHFATLAEMGYGDADFQFVGQDPPYMDEGASEYDAEKTAKVRAAERKNGYEMWARDPKGEGEEVKGKRKTRDFWGVQGGREAESRVSEVFEDEK